MISGFAKMLVWGRPEMLTRGFSPETVVSTYFLYRRVLRLMENKSRTGLVVSL